MALKTVPMGWLSAVGIVQAAIRHLAFKEAGLPMTQELQKNKPLPEGDRFLLYLDSVDQLRVVSRAMSSVILESPLPSTKSSRQHVNGLVYPVIPARDWQEH